MNKKEYKALLEVRDTVATRHTTGRNRRPLVTDKGTIEYHYCLVGAINEATHIPQNYCSENHRWLPRFGRRKWATRNTLLSLIEERVGHAERFNDNFGKKRVLHLLDSIIEENEPKNMEIGKPEKQIIAEPAEKIPGIKESPAPAPEPVKEPVAPEREKVPA